MREPEQLRKLAEAAEDRAATLARALAGELLRPTRVRGALADGLADLAAVRGEVGHLVMLMRQVIGPPARHERRPRHGRIATPQYLRDLRLRLRLWDRAVAAVAVCIAGHEWPLVPDPPPVLDLGAMQGRLNADLLTAVTHALTAQEQTPEAVDLGCFPDIPLNAARFMRNIHLAKRVLLARKHAGPVRFIDIGCGGGLRVAQAAQVFAVAEGLDYDAGYVAVAGRTLAAMQAVRARVFQADGLTFVDYADYDVLYFYEPMYEPQLLTLEAIVTGAARPGAIVISPSHRFELRAEGLGLTRIHDAVYLKDLNTDDVAALVAETRRMGPHIVKPGDRLSPEAAWVGLLWDACRANGIDPDLLHEGSA